MGFDVLGGGGAGGGGGTGGGVVVNIGGNTTGTTANINSGTFVLAGGNNITLSQSSNTITISAGGQGSFWRPAYPGTPIASLTYGQSSAYWFYQNAPMNVSVSAVNVPINVSVSTSSNSSHAGTLSFAIGLYTRNASTLSAATTGSVSYAWTDTAGQSSTILSGLRYISVPFSANITPGDYWIGVLSQTATANANWISFSNGMHNYLATGPLGSFMQTTNNTNNFMLGFGHLSAQTAALPSTVGFSAISGTGSKDHMGPMLYFQNATA